MKLSRHKQPEIELVTGITPVNPEKVLLDNGIPVYLIDTSDQDLVKVEFLFRAGRWFEDKILTADFTNKMLTEGTESLSSKEIADKVDYYGAHLETSADKDMGYVTLYTLNKHLEHTLPVLADVIMNPVFPEMDLDILKQNRKQNFLVNDEKVRYMAKRKFSGLIFGKDHPYGKTFEKEDFDNIQQKDLVEFHHNLYTSKNCKIIASGKIKSDLVQQLNKMLSGFNGKKVEFEFPDYSINTNGQDRKNKIRKKSAVQSAIRIGRALFNKNHPDYAKLKILNMVLGGYFGSRLMTNIREDKGYTYGIGSAIVSLQQSGYFFIASEVGSDVTNDALKEIYYEINVLQQDLIPEEELDLVKNYTLGSLLRSLDGPFAMSDNFKSLLEYGLDFSYLQSFVETIKSVTAEELRELAQKYLETNKLSELTVGD